VDHFFSFGRHENWQTEKLTLCRYHGKCLKIARGKVKEFDKYTCPICDWRRKIPRDAARPKLEDLQDWQAEIAGLPFQPDEEEVLNSIVKQATQFREFLQGFTNAACTTSEEVPTLIFYLRKIEGAEVLLAYETNFFRQEIHKWAPVAPDPPPILEQSLSTRKPRPTKSQKIMAQLGVDRVEDLPPHLRPKTSQAGKRKSVDATQPGRGPQPGGSGTTDYQPDTPGDNGAGIENSSTPFFSGSYANLGQDSSPSFRLSSTPEPGPALLPHAGGHSTAFPSGASPHGLDQPLFSGPSVFRDPQESAPGVGIDTGNPFSSSPPRQEMTDVFADLTNDDPEAVGPMENTHANEALEALDVSNGSERHDSNNEGDGDISGPGDDVETHDRDGDGF
jgi:histone demethylase JARID1